MRHNLIRIVTTRIKGSGRFCLEVCWRGFKDFFNSFMNVSVIPVNDFVLNFENRPRYLFVKGVGIRKSLASIFEGTREFSRIVEETKSKFILLDYSEMVTTVSVADVFNITRLYEMQTPMFYQLCVSIVINQKELHFEEFWEEICRTRGFNFKIFISTSAAEQWLLEQVSLSQ